MHNLQLLLYLVMYLVIIFNAKIADNNFQQNDNMWQIWLIISILLTTKMSCMLKHFQSRISAEVEQLCLLPKLWYEATIYHVADESTIIDHLHAR